MSEHSCGSGCGCAPKASTASTSSSTTKTATAIKNGKGSGPRNMSKKFLSNYEGIRWESAGKKRKEGSKFVKVY
ncbi:MAG TPA: hypothetical protein VIM58_11445 [Candidatus Methylacidiphilales bacterium]